MRDHQRVYQFIHLLILKDYKSEMIAILRWYLSGVISCYGDAVPIQDQLETNLQKTLSGAGVAEGMEYTGELAKSKKV